MSPLKNINKLLIILFGLLFFACEEPFMPDIEIDNYKNMLVVEGIITNEQGPFRIKLSSSVPLDSTVSSFPVDGALVEIYDNTGNTYQLLGQGEGWYETLSTDLKATSGIQYSLTVSTPDGKHFESSPTQMTESPDIENLYFEEIPITNYDASPPEDEQWLNILINSKGNEGGSSYVKWEFEETWEINIPNEIEVADARGNVTQDVALPNNELRFCWVTKKSNSIKVASTEHLEQNEIVNFPIKTIGPRGNELRIKYSILVKQYSLNKELFNFWSTLKEYNENLGSMFDKTPSSIYGNITCCDTNEKSLGYFMVSEVKQKRIFIDRTQHRISTRTGYESCLYSDSKLDPADIYFGRTVETNKNLYNPFIECVDCRTEGTNKKPIFWE